jgi:hypothetical protein
MHRNISFGFNVVDWVRSLRKIRTCLHGTNFSINCTSSPRFAPSFMQLWNIPKWTQTLWNTPKQEFRAQWCGSGVFVVKNYNVTSWHKLLYELNQFSNVLQQVSCSYEMIPNTPKYNKMDRIISLGSNGMDWVRSLRKIQHDFVAWTFTLIPPVHPVLHQVSCSYEAIPNAPNTMKHTKNEFRV